MILGGAGGGFSVQDFRSALLASVIVTFLSTFLMLWRWRSHIVRFAKFIVKSVRGFQTIKQMASFFMQPSPFNPMLMNQNSAGSSLLLDAGGSASGSASASTALVPGSNSTGNVNPLIQMASMLDPFMSTAMTGGYGYGSMRQMERRRAQLLERKRLIQERKRKTKQKAAAEKNVTKKNKYREQPKGRGGGTEGKKTEGDDVLDSLLDESSGNVDDADEAARNSDNARKEDPNVEDLLEEESDDDDELDQEMEYYEREMEYMDNDFFDEPFSAPTHKISKQELD